MKALSKRSAMVVWITVMLLTGLMLNAQDQSSQVIKCPECAHLNDRANAFCLNCGTSLESVKPEQPAPNHDTKKVKSKLYDGPIDPHRLFKIPTADVLKSMEVSLGGGGVIGEMKEEKRPFLGRISLGMGGIAEIEASTVNVINGLRGGSSSIPTVAFKLKLLPEGSRFPYVGVAGALRSSLWYSEVRNQVEFEKRVSTLYFVATRSIGDVKLHGGMSVSDLRIRTREAGTKILISPTPAEADASDKDYFNKNVLSPFVGLSVQANEKTMLMLEFEYVPEYDFDDDNPMVSTDQISSIWMLIAGLRFYIWDWLPLDTGILYRGDYHGIGDMHIHAGLNFNFHLPKVFKSMQTK